MGFCHSGVKIRVARIALHHWEEPSISGTNGSGTIFFSGCNLRCCFCQNSQISQEGFGQELTVSELAAGFLDLQRQKAHNINLVTPSHWVPQIASAIMRARELGLTVPIVYNSSAYEKVSTLKMLDGLVDVFLPDLKFHSATLSQRYLNASDYFLYASDAILEMERQCGPVVLDPDGIIRSGLIIRHLVMPGSASDSIACLEWIRSTLPPQTHLSIMAQYLPLHHAPFYPEINRTLTATEYQQVLDKLEELKLENGFIQELQAASENYIPDFDLTGIKK
jgi:putative pyruvate formate lyase activating enzyme